LTGSRGGVSRALQRTVDLAIVPRLLLCLIAFAPALHAQAARQTDSVVIDSAAPLGTPRVALWPESHRLMIGPNQSGVACRVDGSIALRQSCAGKFQVSSIRDSTLGPQSGGPSWLGAAVGLGLGAGVGYLVAIPRVRATERRGDGPFEQIEYLIDPVIGGILGGVVGAVLGPHVR
jgi:hypothetical protein